MPFICYVKREFSGRSQNTINKANDIIEEYEKQGFKLTLRQLYYQFVSCDWLPNNIQSYKNLGSVINDARLAGLVDWESIEDRTRELRGRQHWNTPGEIMKAVATSYHVDRWAGQETRPEVWIEKDALLGVFEDVCRKWDVSYFSCRGYTSQSEMWAAAERMRIRYEETGQRTRVLHFGDHDPSGIDMSRDIEERLQLFLNGEGGEYDPADYFDCMEFVRMALHKEHVKALKLPANPAKLTDSRARGYLMEHGKSSWELDALEPKILVGLVNRGVEKMVTNAKAWDYAHKKEERGQAKILAAAKKFNTNNDS